MKNTKKKEIAIVLLLIVAVILMTVGFALYTQTLNINGTVTVKGSPWNVHYIENQITPTTGSVTATSATVSKTDFAFTVTLEKPGDFYEATVTVQNEGTIGAVLKTLTMSSLTTEQAKYLTYTVTYNGTEYSATANNLSTALAAAGTAPVKVRVEYKADAEQNDLPTTDQTVTVTGSLYYESAT